MDFGALMTVTALVVSIIALIVSTVFALQQLKSVRTSNNTAIAIELLSRELLNDRFEESESFVTERLTKEHAPGSGVSGLPPVARAHVYRVAWYYSSLGHLTVFGAIDERLVLSMVNYRLRRAWFVLEPYIRAERAIRRAPFFAFFEHMAYRASHVMASDLHRKLRLCRFDEPDGTKTRAFPGEGEFPPHQAASYMHQPGPTSV